MAAIVFRGGCGFGDKALVAAKLGAAALIVVNSKPSAEPMMVDPAVTVTIPSVMVGSAVATHLESLDRLGCGPAGGIIARMHYHHR